MFSISKAITEYTWPVAVHLPADGGKVEKSTFDATFKRVSATRINEIREAIEAGKITDIGLASEVLTGWSGISDGEDVLSYSEANKAALLDIPTVAAAVVRAFFESLAGAPRKLIDAATRWASGGVKDEVASDFAAFGAPQELVEMHTASEALEIWPENVEVVTAFLRLQTQWILGAMGGVLGLNYQAVESLFNILGTQNRIEIFDGLQVMERAALAVLNRKD